MMKNRHLSKAVASQKFYEFRIKLKAKSALLPAEAPSAMAAVRVRITPRIPAIKNRKPVAMRI